MHKTILAVLIAASIGCHEKPQSAPVVIDEKVDTATPAKHHGDSVILTFGVQSAELVVNNSADFTCTTLSGHPVTNLSGPLLTGDTLIIRFPRKFTGQCVSWSKAPEAKK